MTASNPIQVGVVISAGPDDCVGAIFEGEQEAVVFIPASGDILLSGAEAWRDINGRACASACESGRSAFNAMSAESQPLLKALQHIGVSID